MANKPGNMSGNLPWLDFRESELSTFAGTWFVREFCFFSIWMIDCLSTKCQWAEGDLLKLIVFVVVVGLEVDVSSTWS